MTLALAPDPVDTHPRGTGPRPDPEDLWDRHGASVYALACVLLGDEGAASRAVRSAMSDFARSTEDVAPGEARRSLARLVHRHAQDLEGTPSTTAQLPRIMTWVSGLARLQRESLALCAYGGLTHREAAALLGVQPGTVADLLSSALRELARLTAAPVAARA
jgi:hypothetical protein